MYEVSIKLHNLFKMTTVQDETSVKAFFSDIPRAIKTFLEKSDGAYVCSAWFTSIDLVNVLSELPFSEVIVGDEKFISSECKECINKLLPNKVFLYKGNIMMHNKFIVLLKETITFVERSSLSNSGASLESSAGGKVMESKLIPDSVITGSANYTTASSSNYENIVWIHDPKIALEYFQEYTKIKKLCKKYT